MLVREKECDIIKPLSFFFSPTQTTKQINNLIWTQWRDSNLCELCLYLAPDLDVDVRLFFAQRRNLVPSFSMMVAFPGCVSELMTQLAETRKAADRVVTACVMYLSRGCLPRRPIKEKNAFQDNFFRETFTIRFGPVFKNAYPALIAKESSNKVAAVAAAAATR